MTMRKTSTERERKKIGYKVRKEQRCRERGREK